VPVRSPLGDCVVVVVVPLWDFVSVFCENATPALSTSPAVASSWNSPGLKIERNFSRH
jgi:hypothetical protein